MKAFRLAIPAFATSILVACSGGGGGGGGGGKQQASYSETNTASGSDIIWSYITYYTDGTQSIEKFKVKIEGPTTVGADHVTVNGTFSVTNRWGSGTITVEPSISAAPTLTSPKYPENWTSNGGVTPTHVSTVTGTYYDGTAYVADGTSMAPFRQATLTPNGPAGAGAINDTNAFVSFNRIFYSLPPSKVYDFRWGNPDPAGPGYVTTWFGANWNATSYTKPGAISIAGHTVSGQTSPSSGMTLSVPASDVKNA